MRICLIRCPSPFLIDERMFPPLGLLAVGTALKLRRHHVHIHDEAIEDVPSGFTYYGLGPTTPEYHLALTAKEAIKQRDPNARVVIGGAHATLNPQECRADGFDCVVVHDGEPVAERAFVGEDTILDGTEQSPLDDYPIIDRSLVKIRSYSYMLDGRPATTIMTSRGCPYKCGFCCKTYCKVRLRSADSIISEVKYLQREYGYEALAFPEDVFILNRQRVEDICRYLRAANIVWRCLARADLIVKYGSGFVRMMAESGCMEIAMGVESGSDKILSIIDKGETSKVITTAVKLIKQEGVRVKGFFIVGLPGETLQTLDETRRFLRDVGLDAVDIKIFQPYPGSPIWDKRSDYDIDWSDMDSQNMFYKGREGEYFGSVETSSLTNAQIVQAWTEMEAAHKWTSAS